MSKTKTFITISYHKWHINRCIIKMESNNELKEIDIKNCTCYYFDETIKIENFNLDSILISEKPY